MSANCDCGCGGGTGDGCGCGGAGQATLPLDTTNRPGLPALSYRIGTHSAFFDAMIARLSSQDFPALARLTTRELSDASIALLDGWALVGDVLTFYQERIANEGYLRTATERRSILELARLIGYKLRPGVAASVYLAYSLDEDRTKNPAQPTQTTIPTGSRVQSVPGPGQLPQAFETSLDLDARSAWNTLGLRLTQPQAFTAAQDAGTDITTRDTVYFSGTATNLKPGDPLMFVLGTNEGQQTLRLVQSVETQTPQARTEIVLQSPPLAAATSGTSPLTFVTTAVSSYVTDAASLFPDSTFAAKAAALLSNPPPASPPGLLENIQSSAQISGAATAALVQDCITSVSDLHDTAVSRNFTRLEPWLADILTTLNSLVSQLQALGTKTSFATPQIPAAVEFKRSNVALGRLTSLLPSLALPPSLQPANSLQLARTVQGTFSPTSDMAPRLLGAFLPAAASMLYRAWTHYQNPVVAAPVVGAVRLKTGLFPGGYPGAPTVVAGATPTTSFDNPPTVDPDWAGLFSQDNKENYLPLGTIALDGVYDKILAGSWVMIDRPKFTFTDGPSTIQLVGRTQTFHKVTQVASVAMTTSDGGFSAKSTQLTLDPPWLSDVLADSSQTAHENQNVLDDLIGSGVGLLAGTVVYAQTEVLNLAEEPLDVDVVGDTLELDDAYDGLESGRWVIVSGERTDIPNVTGVTGSELVMLLGVAQNTFVEDVTRPGAVHTILTLANKLAYTYRRESVIVYGNVVKATHGQTYNEILGNGDATQAFQEFQLKQKPLTFVSASNPEGTDSTLKVYVNNVEWHETDMLAGLSPKDRSFITQTDDDDNTGVTFGNGQQGARLPTGSGNITAIYRSGIGQPGNVDAGQISLLQSRPLNVKSVINPLRASGGADRDSRDQARRNAPLAVMALDRLVSVQDYADFARTFAGIGKADASRLSDTRRELVYLTIAGAGDIPIDPSSDLYKNLGLALHANGDPYQPVQIAVRQVRFIVISVHLKILPDYLWEPVAAAVRTALLDAFSFDNRTLGQAAFQSEAISIMQAVAGVAYVDLDKFDSIAEGDDLGNLGDTLGLNPVVAAALARPNPKPINLPDDAILPAELAYLNPDLPDTLILNEVKS